MFAKRGVCLSLGLLAGLWVFMPISASAQQASGIAGVVRDTSGAVLPGVTVEAASPALIEKVRTVVTDGEGRYNVADLRPGSYVVTFALAGFSTVKREGINLPAGFTATVNADMTVGALEETITVSGAAPLVDTQNVRQQQLVSAELLSALPSGSKGLVSMGKLIPGMTLGEETGAGGANGIYQANTPARATFHGKGGSKTLYDGMQTNNLAGTGGSVSYIMNPSTALETAVMTGGISPESDASGIAFNMIPKEGGNLVRGTVDFTYTNEHLQANNLNDTLRARGLGTPGKSLYSYDTNFTVGGPITKDKLWFFAATRFTGTRNQVAGKYFNKTQGTLLFTPDLDRLQYRQDWLRSQAGRMTWQASRRNKVNAFGDAQYFMTRGDGNNTAPEAQTCYHMWPQGLYQGTWTSPVTNKFLLEAVASLTKGPFPCSLEEPTDIYGFAVKPTDVSVLDSSTGFRYNARASYSTAMLMNRFGERASASYVTGSHSFKAGFQLQQHVHNQFDQVNGDVTYTFNGTVPTRITQRATPYEIRNRTKADFGLFAQDQWAVKRLTLNYGVRFDYFNGYTPAQRVEAGRFMAARDYPEVSDVPNWKDLNPRVGGSYDLFGTGQTALKASLGRYSGRQSVEVAQANNPIATSVNATNRSWTDANKDYVPDCVLTNFAANGECGAIDNINFGGANPNAVRYADNLIRGWGNRDYLWDLSAEVQHELRPGTSMTGGYYRNWSNQYPDIGQGWGTAVFADNQAVTQADYSPFCITAPLDSRLPGGGGYPVCGLYDVSPAKFGVGQIVNVRASDYDNGMVRTSDFFTVSVDSRLGKGILVGASLDTGRTVDDKCFTIDSPQQLLNCRIVTPFKGGTQIKMNGSYPLPKGIVVSGILQNVSGVSYNADYTASNAEIKPSLGRNLAACGTRVVCTSTVIVPLIAPKTQFEPRRTLLDIRLSKVFNFGSRSLKANLDLYNALNSGSVIATNNNYGAFWLQPTGPSGGIVAGRLINFGAQLNF